MIPLCNCYNWVFPAFRWLTHALALVVLVDEHVVQHEVEQLVLQGGVGVEDQWLEPLPAPRHQLVAEDHQQVTQQHEGLEEGRERQSTPTEESPAHLKPKC